jgi:hypothetical protein
VSDVQIDAERTNPIAQKELEKTDAYKQIEALKKEMAGYAQQAKQAFNNAKRAIAESEKSKIVDEYKARSFQAREVEEKIKPLVPVLQAEYKELIIKHAVYFESANANEFIVNNGDEILVKLNEAVSLNKKLSRDLKMIDDYRGKTFYKKVSGKWIEEKINVLGQKPAEGFKAELSEAEKLEYAEQKETERIKNLSVSEREKELSQKIDALLSQSITMRSSLEIQGDPEALKKAQEWYLLEKGKVEALYS